MANKRKSMGGARVADTLRRPLKPVTAPRQTQTAPKTQPVPNTSATTRIRRDPTPTWGAGNAQRAAGRDYVRLLVCLALAVSMVEWWVSRRGY